MDFLGLQKEVDRNRIGLLGICGWGGMALNDVAMDTRVKAVATSVMYDMSRAMGHGVGAVSYTHLDVYKRQTIYRSDINGT